MWTRRALLGTIAGCCAQELPNEAPEPEVEFICPMDPDVRSKTPSSCPRCGMKLVAGLPSMAEYPVDLSVAPKRIRVNEPVELRFRVRDPKTRATAKLQLIHERLFHLFLISEDLEFFAHEHPELQPDGTFTYMAKFPRPGMYRVGCDIYPQGGWPQMVTRTLIVPGAMPSVSAAKLVPDYGVKKKLGGLEIALRTEPVEPLAGKRTLLFYDIAPAKDIEPWLGAWGHLMFASSDLQDLVHTHPFLLWGEGRMQFNVIFPRAGVHRVWLQFQNGTEIVTAPFDVPVKVLG